MDPTDTEIEIQLPDNTFGNNDDVVELPPANDNEVGSPPDEMVDHERHAKPLGTGTGRWTKKKKLAVGLAATATFVAATSIGIVVGGKNRSAANDGVVVSSASMMTLEQCLKLDEYSEYATYAFDTTPTPTPTTYQPTTYNPTESEGSSLAASDDVVFPIQYDDQIEYMSNDNDGNGRRELVATGYEKSLRLSKKIKEEKIGRVVHDTLNPASGGRRLSCDDIVYEAYGGSKSAKTAKSSKAVEPCGSTKSAKSTCTPTSSPTNVPTNSPTSSPTSQPTSSPTSQPTSNPTSSPTSQPTSSPTPCPRRPVTFTAPAQAIRFSSASKSRTFNIRVNVPADSQVTVRVFTRGDINNGNEFYRVRTELSPPYDSLGQTDQSASPTCGRNDPYISKDFTIPKNRFNNRVRQNNGSFMVTATANSNVSPCSCFGFGCYRDTVYVQLRYRTCSSPPPPTPGPSPSCMSGDMRVPTGNYLDDEDQDYRYVQNLAIGDSIEGLDENKDPMTCSVKAIGYFGEGEVFGNYTDHHYVLDSSNNVVQAHGQDGESQFVDKFAVLTSCPAGLDESGTGFTAIDSDFVGNDDPILWSDYVLIHKGILNLVEEVGPSVFSPSAYTSMDTVKQYTQQFYKTMLTCIKDSSDCDEFEMAAQELIDNALTDDTKAKVMSTFSNLGVSTQSGSIAAAMSRGESVRG